MEIASNTFPQPRKTGHPTESIDIAFRAAQSPRRALGAFHISTDFNVGSGAALLLRTGALTHDAENGTSTPMLLTSSRHASIRSLERYARPGVDTVARHVAERAPAARRNAPS
ncbi:hypothetical protein [Sphaerisporangium sp. NPDC051011]|uniref:hypothetical protein n=1 Tax=Sphaerisporangium sp. NPDC051011 TaxID=3155792 RepID=UPI0033EBF37A